MALWGWLMGLVKGAVKGLAKGALKKTGISSAKGAVKGVAKSAIGGAMSGGGSGGGQQTPDSGTDTAVAQSEENKKRGVSSTTPKIPEKSAGTDPTLGQVVGEIGKGYVKNHINRATGNIGQGLQSGGKIMSALGAKKTGGAMKNIGGYLSSGLSNKKDYEDDEDQQYKFIGGSQR